MRVVQVFGPLAAASATSTRPVFAGILFLLVAVTIVGDLVLLLGETW